MNKYDGMTDAQLIQRLRDGETAITDYIMNKYKYLVEQNAKAMYLVGAEEKDLIQEGMIGLFKAILDYDESQEASFYTFAKLCISRQLYTAIKLSQRQKHIPLNFYISLYGESEEEDGEDDKSHPLIEVLSAEGEHSPEELFLDKEYFAMIRKKMKESLSDLESKVLYLYLRGEDYKSIANLLDKSPKSIDNALQRIKQKMSTILE